MSSQAPRTSARMLAPLALAACAVAVLIVFATSISGGDGGSSGDSVATPETATDQTTASTTTQQKPQPATYTVQPGDTLGGISEETGVPVEDLELLNPELDPQALIAGQKIKLRE